MTATATLHKGRSWWVIPTGAKGFNQMPTFRTREAALGWATGHGYTITAETTANG